MREQSNGEIHLGMTTWRYKDKLTSVIMNTDVFHFNIHHLSVNYMGHWASTVIIFQIQNQLNHNIHF